MAWIASGDDHDAIAAAVPEIGDHFCQLYRSFWQLPQIPAEVLELCRLRLAQLHASELQWGLEEVPVAPEKRENLRDWSQHEVFSPAERACLEITEIHAMDARAISDEQAEAVKQHFGDVGLVALFQALGVFDGMIRLGLVWGLGQQEVT